MRRLLLAVSVALLGLVLPLPGCIAAKDAGWLLVLCAAPVAAQQPGPDDDLQAAIRRMATIRPRFPDGFGSTPPAVHPAIVRPGLFSVYPPIREAVAPSADRLAGTTAEGDLYVRATGSQDRRIIARAEAPWRWDVEGAAWSPDGRRIAVKRIDDHAVPRIPIVDWAGDHEAVRSVPYSRVGEPLPKEQVMIVDVASGHATPVAHGFDDPYVHVLGWSADGRSLRLLRADRLLKHVDLLSADAATGAVRRILRDSSRTFVVGLPLLDGFDHELKPLHLAWFLDSRGEFLWTSERSGFQHIYLYRAGGRLVRPLTTTLPGLVHRIEGVDERRGWVYFTASTDTLHPYRQQLYRVSLEGGKPRELTQAGVLGGVEFSPSMDSIAVLRLGLPDLYQVDVMNANGANAQTFWKADLGFLKRIDFAPEVVWSLAADGRTRLRSMLVKPARFDSSRRHPVIEIIRGTPDERVVPEYLTPALVHRQALADQGFVVVVTDGRGTPGRGKAFEDFAYGRIGQVEIADHAAVLRELARDRPYMDLSRVGLLGVSWGGYFALRALLIEPQLYKAAYLAAAAVDLPRFRVAIEPYMGCLPADCPAAYGEGKNTPLIPKLQGHLSINQGTADRDVPFAAAMNLVHTLEAAGKDFELTVYPGGTHQIGAWPGIDERTNAFFRWELQEGDAAPEGSDE
ncbi:MAG TPA: DPP IV N-terminal domain-containing protein [Gemmatimonadales bacterium]|nr:DPP IV N-terminal domain-containing protein [Gemmatimonadales bacterium]